MAPQVVRLWNQMAEPKFAIAMGACAISGGPFRRGYNVLRGVDRFIPVDLYIPGCPPRPEALLHGLMELQKKMREDTLVGKNAPRYFRKDTTCAFPVPAYGEHDLVPACNSEIWHPRAPIVREEK
jgi:NADH-quinone oxidoreductase subunit B